MNLTMQDMGSVMETIGIEGNFAGPGQISEEMRATAIPEREGKRGTGFGINTTLLNGILEFLEAKLQ